MKLSGDSLLISLTIVTIGALLLLQNFGLFHPTWWLILFDLWPLYLVLVGIRLMTRNSFLYSLSVIVAFGVVWFFVYARAL